jgi:hypothetical protein
MSRFCLSSQTARLAHHKVWRKVTLSSLHLHLIDRNNFVALKSPRPRKGLAASARCASSSVCISPVFGRAAKQSDLRFQLGDREGFRQTWLVAQSFWKRPISISARKREGDTTRKE